MSEDTSVKYLDVDSTFRNRNNYPNPYDFVIPYSFPNKGSTSLGFFDAVLESSPYSGSPTLQPGQLVTEGTIPTTMISRPSSTTTEITLDLQDTSINNFYIHSTLQLGTEFRDIISYNGVTKLCIVSKPFPVAPPPETIYYIRKQKTYFDSEVGISSYDTVSNTVDKLLLLTGKPSPLKDFYKGSYIRFKNGDHVGETALITKYDPFSTLQIWNQESSPGKISVISTQNEGGFRFLNTVSGFINSFSIELTSFDSISNRRLSVILRDGFTFTGELLYSETFNIPNTFDRSNFNIQLTDGPLLSSNNYYTLSLIDVTDDTENTNGFLNIFGIKPTDKLVTSDLSVYPKTTIDVRNGPDVIWSQPTPSGNTTYISTIGENGYVFIPEGTLITNIDITLISFEAVSNGRTITLRIRSDTFTGTIIYEGNFLISNTSQTPSVISLDLGNVSVLSGNTYVLTIQDITLGGVNTGFINVFGIDQNTSYVTFNTQIYPQIDIFSTIRFTDKISGSVPGIEFGTSVSLSGDGNTLAFGAQLDDNGIGSTLIFTRSGGGWTQQGSKLVGTGYTTLPRQGFSVDLSGDGNTLAVGGHFDNGGVGSTWVFTRSGGVWTQQGSKLVGTGAIGLPRQGYSVGLSGDGNTLAVGGYLDNGSIGATWVFTRSGGVWTQQGSKLLGIGYIGTPLQGSSVSLSGDGNTIAVGGYADNGSIGATWIGTRSGGVWTQQGSKLVGTGAIGPCVQGISVFLSSDGNTLAVGGYADNVNIGATWVWTRSGGVWTQQGSKLVGTGAIGKSNQGWSVSLSVDGNKLASGGYGDNNFVGATWIFERIGGIWSQISKFVGSGNIGSSRQGFSVSLSYDGDTLAVSGTQDNSSRGAVWIDYNLNQSVFSQPTNPITTSVISTTTTQGLQFTPINTGDISDISLDISSFQYNSPGRSLLLEVVNGPGTGGTSLYSATFIIPNTVRGIYTIPIINSGNIISGNIYTLKITDITPGGTTNGSIYIYGINPNITYVTYNISTYPLLSINTSDKVVTTFSQSSSPTISQNLSTVSDIGFLFSPSFDGELKSVLLSLTSFDTGGYRTLNVKLLDGAGLSGNVLNNIDVDVYNTKNIIDYNLILNFNSPILYGNDYTLSVRDITTTGSSTGVVTLYGITPSSPYISYNTTVYPRLNIRTTSFVITISPPKSIDGFINAPPNLLRGTPDSIEFNSQANENATTLFQNGVQAHNAQYYKIGLKYLVIPNRILNVSRGGHLDNYPYIYVQIYNDGNRGALNVISSSNPNAALAVFKCPIDKSLYDRPTSFFTLKIATKDQIVKFRPDQNIRITLSLPDGSIISNKSVDNLTPLFPNPLLQFNALFTLLPVDKYDYTPNV